ncbi:MAG: ribbon-helix-helix protein, CopG family [Methylocystaceae bacterium]|nr:ribbon-helix-helix protein, CopG family [Methylocystaceae bacterium]
MAKKIKCTTYLDIATYEKLSSIAKTKDRSKSWILNEALKEYLSKQNDIPLKHHDKD